jgi:hypothetical protein
MPAKQVARYFLDLSNKPGAGLAPDSMTPIIRTSRRFYLPEISQIFHKIFILLYEVKYW